METLCVGRWGEHTGEAGCLLETYPRQLAVTEQTRRAAFQETRYRAVRAARAVELECDRGVVPHLSETVLADECSYEDDGRAQGSAVR